MNRLCKNDTKRTGHVHDRERLVEDPERAETEICVLRAINREFEVYTQMQKQCNQHVPLFPEHQNRATKGRSSD